MPLKFLLCLSMLNLLVACQSTNQAKPVHQSQQKNLAQYQWIEQKLRAGMHQNQIVSTLGAPKVIQNGARPGERNKEIWLFDIKVKDITYIKNKKGQEEVLLKFISDPFTKVRQKVGTIEVKFNRRGLAESIIYTLKAF